MTGPRLRVIALLTAHNRREKTLACLETLQAQSAARAVQLSAILVDDGSTDGTGEAVRSRFPWVEIVPGSGQLYWNGGMRLAFARALPRDPDHYLLVNDDTLLAQDAVERLIATSAWARDQGELAPIVAGSTRDPATGRTNYGGQARARCSLAPQFRLMEPATVPLRCETFNANCVLISRPAAARVGNLEAEFTHALGDFDYGLRATAAGCGCWVAPGHFGECATNEHLGTFHDPSVPLLARWKHMLGPKGLPVREWRVFTKRHCGRAWPVYWAGAYVNFWRRALLHRGGAGFRT